MIYRKPRIDELDNLLIIAEYYRDEAGIKEEDYDENVVIDSFRELMIRPDNNIVCAIENNRIVGFIAGSLIPSLWGKQIFSHIQFIYILPSHRNLTTAKELIKDFEDWSKNNGVCKITAGDIGIDVSRSKALYEQCGFSNGCWLSKDL